MKKSLFVMGLALALTLAAERRAAAEGGFKICFGVSCSKWNGCCDNGGGACFPCVDPALFGLGGGYGYPGYTGHAMPYPYAAPQAPAPAAAHPVQYLPQWGSFSGYQPVGYHFPMYYSAPSYWYGY